MGERDGDAINDEGVISDLNSPVDVDRAIHQWDMADGFRLDFVPAGSGVLGIVLIVAEGTRSRDLEEARH